MRIWRFWKLGLLVVGVFMAVIGWNLFTGPRMKEQEHIRTYDARMPLPPEGSVRADVAAWPKLRQIQQRNMANPLDPTQENISAGRTYYGYYCLSCHGAKGDGHGPVGESFIPVPSDLRTGRVKAMTDAQLMAAMLTGPGHRPADAPADLPYVLQYTVNPDHRWPLVLYVRQLGK